MKRGKYLVSILVVFFMVMGLSMATPAKAADKPIELVLYWMLSKDTLQYKGLTMFMDFLYRQAIDVQGVIMDFGTRWGQNMSYFTALRAIYEPYNRHKKIIGFDTFDGFPSISEKDGTSEMIELGNIKVTDDYLPYLDELMQCQEGDNPLSHIKKYEFVVGDACKKIYEYLEEYPETIVAMAFFDFDLYEPTKVCLEAIKPRLVKGSVLGFDELNDHDSPGETAALMEVFGLNNVKLRRYRHASRVSYFIVE